MTQTLIVETPFTELAEMVDGLAPRVDGTRITLWTGEQVADGDVVRFSVRLADGSPCFEGNGMCVAIVDQGEDAYAPERFEVTLDALELDARNDVVFERLTLAVESGGGRGTGEVDIGDIEALPASDYPAELVSEAPPSLPPSARNEHTTEMQLDDLVEDLGDGSIPPPSFGDTQSSAQGGAPAIPRVARRASTSGVLSRPSLDASWQPEAVARGESMMGSGKFAYGDNGLPRPASPPRPDGQQVRVEPAPRP